MNCVSLCVKHKDDPENESLGTELNILNFILNSTRSHQRTVRKFNTRYLLQKNIIIEVMRIRHDSTELSAIKETCILGCLC